MKKKYNNLKDVRNAIDKLDDKILPLMIKRSQLVENALELKKLKSQIRDPKRIKIILDKIEKNSENSEAFCQLQNFQNFFLSYQELF